MVVIVASALATVYVALLDRFWAFVTDLVYGSLMRGHGASTHDLDSQARSGT